MWAYCPHSRHVQYFIIHCQWLKINVDFRGESVRWSQTPSPLAYAVYAFINVDNCERPLNSIATMYDWSNTILLSWVELSYGTPIILSNALTLQTTTIIIIIIIIIRCRLLWEGWLSWSSMAPDLEQFSRGLRIAFSSILWWLATTPFLAFLCLVSTPVDHPMAAYGCCYVWSYDQSRWFFFSSLLELCKAVRLPVLGLLHLFSYPSISNDCIFFIFLVVIVHVLHPYKSVDHTYAFIILFLVFILMCRAVIVFNIELNASLAISIIFKISTSHFPFDVIVCPK